MANNEKTEEYLTEVMKGIEGESNAIKGLSADDIEIPDEQELRSLDEVKPAIEDMSDEEFLQMLARETEKMTESIKTETESEPEPELMLSPEVEEEPEPDFGLKLEPDEEESAGNAGLSNIVDLDDEMPETGGEKSLEDDMLKGITEGDEGDLMASLDSIVQEIHGESTASGFSADDSAMNMEDGQESYSEGFDDGLFLEEEEGEEPASEKAEKRTKEKRTKEKKKAKQKKQPKNQSSFGNKIKNLFFRVEVVEPLSEEELEQQKILKEKEKEEKKKAAAEAKKQKAAEKKEAAKQKKEEAAAKKAAKPKKEKKPKAPKEPVGPEEIIHIRPMFLVFMVSVTAAVVLITVSLSDSYGYKLAVRDARKYMERNRYEEAFEMLNGMELKGLDEELYESARILMRVEKQYRSYVNYTSLNMPNEALDSLLKAVKNYDKYSEYAESYGIKEDLDGLLSNVEYALNTGYGLDLTTVREWNTLEDSNEYTKKIMTCTGSY